MKITLKPEIQKHIKKSNVINEATMFITTSVGAKLLAKVTHGKHVSTSIKEGLKTDIIPLDGTKIIRLYYQDGLKLPAPALLFIHGGGFIFPDFEYQHKIAQEYASRVACVVCVVEYTVAGEASYPIPLLDCLNAYSRVCLDNRVNRNKIIVCGDSAGGCLAASLCLYARDMGIPILGQMLIYPTLDSTSSTPEIREFWHAPLWSGKWTPRVWRIYKPRKSVTLLSEYLSPLHAESVKNLPTTYIEVNEFDSLRGEGTQYAARLKEAKVPCTLIENTGCCHGFDMFIAEEPAVESYIEHRCAWLNGMFFVTGKLF